MLSLTSCSILLILFALSSTAILPYSSSVSTRLTAFSVKTSEPENLLKVLAEHKLIVIHTKYVSYKSKNAMAIPSQTETVPLQKQALLFQKIIHYEIATKIKKDSIWKAISIGIFLVIFIISVISLAKPYGFAAQHNMLKRNNKTNNGTHQVRYIPFVGL